MIKYPFICNLLSLQDGSWVVTSLCPTLGRMYAQEYMGPCPSHLQDPFGKTLNISFIGPPPFITKNPFGGSAVIVTEILAQKHFFTPNYIQARSVDKVEQNNKIVGMVHRVSFIYSWKNTYFGLLIMILQVSTKHSEMGIGLVSMNHYRFMLVDFLPPMDTNTWFIATQKPNEIASFDSIVIPFDKYVWLFTFVCICAQFLLLVIMQNVYSHVTGIKNPNDYVYEGNKEESGPNLDNTNS